MAHFAQIDGTNTVLRVDVINNETLDFLPFPESEPIGQSFLASLGISGTWIQTSYSGSFRGTYAGVGFIFDPNIGEYGEFYDPRPPSPPTVKE
jgi:hypothetical protein